MDKDRRKTFQRICALFHLAAEEPFRPELKPGTRCKQCGEIPEVKASFQTSGRRYEFYCHGRSYIIETDEKRQVLSVGELARA